MHTIVTLKLAERALGTHVGDARQLVGDALELAEQSNRELRELAHGILPAVLERGGLRAGVDAFVGRLDLLVGLDVPAERFPAEIEASAYFIVAEALTNVVKHSNAQSAEVRTSVEDGMLHVEVRDNGIGGADPDGHGLLGMTDRVTALGGRLKVESTAAGGTLVAPRCRSPPASAGPGGLVIRRIDARKALESQRPRCCGALTKCRRRDSNPDARIMIPDDFGLAIGDPRRIGHAVGHNRTLGGTPFRVRRHRRSRPRAWSVERCCGALLGGKARKRRTCRTFFEAAEGTRTLDLLHGKQTL